MNCRKVRIHDSFGPRPSSGVEVEWWWKNWSIQKMYIHNTRTSKKTAIITWKQSSLGEDSELTHKTGSTQARTSNKAAKLKLSFVGEDKNNAQNGRYDKLLKMKQNWQLNHLVVQCRVHKWKLYFYGSSIRHSFRTT